MPEIKEKITKKSLIFSFSCAIHGLVYSWKTQRNFRIEIFLSIIVVILAFIAKVNLFYIFIGCSIVLSLELTNTAIEVLIDLVSPEWHDLAKIAKDVAASAVLIAGVLVVLGFLYLFLQKIVNI